VGEIELAENRGIPFAENDQPVKAGQSLVDLDPSDYEVQVAQARAAYEQALAQSAAEGPNEAPECRNVRMSKQFESN
jgi:multidrug resistance efflux pump